MPVHDIQVHPVSSGVDGAGGFRPDPAEVGGEEGRGDDAILVGPLFHAPSHRVKTGSRREKKSDQKENLFSEWLDHDGVFVELRDGSGPVENIPEGNRGRDVFHLQGDLLLTDFDLGVAEDEVCRKFLVTGF